MQGVEGAPVMVQGGEGLAEVLIRLLGEVHSIECTHQYTVELNGFRVQRRTHVLKTLHRLLLSYLILSVIKCYLTYVSNSGHIIVFASNALLEESLHDPLHLAALESVFDPPLVPIFTVLVRQHFV